MNETSKARLLTCDPRLQEIFNRVSTIIPTAIICGHRGEAEQDMAHRGGKSKLKFPNSKHNSLPSKAVDAAPSPIEWSDRERFIFFAGVVFAVAKEMGVKILWGGDWNGNGVIRDEKFQDLVHFEILESD